MHTSSAADIETVKQIYAAINGNDIPGVLKFFDPQILRVEFEGTPAEVVCRGLSEVEPHFSKARSTWAEGACTPERLICEGDKVIADVHVRVRLKSRPEWAEGRVGDVFTFRNGKVTEFRSFGELNQALKWAGATSP